MGGRGTISVVANVAIALTLFPSMGAPGIAVASAVAGWLNAIMLLAVLVRRGHWGRDVPLLKRIPRLVLAAALMGAALYFGEHWFTVQLSSAAHLTTKAVTLVGLSAAGAVIYFVIAFAIGGADFGMIRRNIKRGNAKGSPAPVDTE
jgi:putative peptidoglycan lipid II flippase